jgi:curved DNA-binding protein CbpA
MDPFLILGLPERLAVDTGQLEEHFRRLGKEAHPDRGGSAADFERLRFAYEVVKSPAKRIRAMVGEAESRGSVPGEVMDLFGSVAEAMEAVEQFLKERAVARSGLGRAVLDAKIPALRKSLEDLIEKLGDLESGLIDWFPFFDEKGWDVCEAEMGEVARGLVFLEKWQAQIREATGKLFEALLGGMS